MKIRRSIFLLPIVVMLVATLISCATNWGQVANQLSRQKTIMESYAKAAKNAHVDGKITDGQLAQAKGVYERYAALHNATIDSLALAQEMKKEPSNMGDMMSRMNSLTVELYNFLKTIGVY
mgnify:CR=1 FL=1